MATVAYYNGLAGDPAPAWLMPTIKTAIDDKQNQELANISTLEQRTGHYIKFYANKANITVFYYFFNSDTTVYLPADNGGFLDIDPNTTYGQQTSWYRRGSGEPMSFARPWTTFPTGGVTITIADATEIYIEESNIAFDMGGTPFDPNAHDEHIFTKDYSTYKMYVGVAVNDTTQKTGYIYATETYKIRLRWQSLRTGTSYTMDMAGRLVYNNATVLTPSTIPPAPFYSFSYNTDDAAPYAKALRMPVGAYTDAADIPTEYSALTDIRAVSEITLQQLIDYMQTQTAGANEQDVFTEIFAAVYVDVFVTKQGRIITRFCINNRVVYVHKVGKNFREHILFIRARCLRLHIVD